MTKEELKQTVIDGIREVLGGWRLSGGEFVVEVDGNEMSFRVASPPNDHLFEVSVDEGYYKVNIDVEEWE
jgi:hypothetical protein